MAGFVLKGEVKDNHTRVIPKYNDGIYGKSSATYLKSDVSSGRHYIDLNQAMANHKGAWLYGNEHVITHLGRMRAEWEQFCPVPADVRDGILIKGNVFYRHSDGSWVKSPDRFEGMLRTVHGGNGGRYFVGKTQHTFHDKRFRGGQVKVVAPLNLKLSHRAPTNPLFKVPKSHKQALAQYRRHTYTSPVLSYPSYDRDSQDSGF